MQNISCRWVSKTEVIILQFQAELRSWEHSDLAALQITTCTLSFLSIEELVQNQAIGVCLERKDAITLKIHPRAKINSWKTHSFHRNFQLIRSEQTVVFLFHLFNFENIFELEFGEIYSDQKLSKTYYSGVQRNIRFKRNHISL